MCTTRPHQSHVNTHTHTHTNTQSRSFTSSGYEDEE